MTLEAPTQENDIRTYWRFFQQFVRAVNALQNMAVEVTTADGQRSGVGALVVGDAGCTLKITLQN